MSLGQSPLGLCVISLNLPKDWFELDQSSQGGPDQNPRSRHQHRHRQRNRGRWRNNMPSALRTNPGPASDRIQLYYSSPGSVLDFKMPPSECTEDESLQRRLYYVGAVAVPHRKKDHDKARGTMGCSDGLDVEELRLDYNVAIRYCQGPFRAGQPARISINLRSNFTGESVTIR